MRGAAAPHSSPRTPGEDSAAAPTDMAGGRIGLRPSCSARPTGSGRRGRRSDERAGAVSDSRVSARTSQEERDGAVTCDERGAESTRTAMGGGRRGCACASESSRTSSVWTWASRKQMQSALLMTCLYLLLVAAGAAAQGKYKSLFSCRKCNVPCIFFHVSDSFVIVKRTSALSISR